MSAPGVYFKAMSACLKICHSLLYTMAALYLLPLVTHLLSVLMSLSQPTLSSSLSRSR